MKKFVKTLFLTFTLSICISTTGCNAYGTFYKLSEAYEKGFLCRDDLLNIAYYYNGEVNINDSGFVPKEVLDDQLDNSTINQIKHAHYWRIRKDYANITIDQITINSYCGTYGKNVVIRVWDKCRKIDIRTYDEYEIGNVKFLNFVNGDPFGLEVWRK